ncbi:MAG: transposase family protein [Sphaerochaeta sp.]|nr:transposase family protein [Sphaerochaeta sp.]
MDPNSTRGRDLFMEIREAMDTLGGWEADAKAGRKVINRFVSILKKGVADPRVKGKVSYPLSEIIVLSFFATLGGAMTFQDMEVMCTCKQKYFRKFIPLKAGIPSHDTFNRVFSLIDMGEFNKALTDFIKESMEELRKVLHIPEPQMVQLCVDGKEARGSGRQEDADGKVKRNIRKRKFDPSLTLINPR